MAAPDDATAAADDATAAADDAGAAADEAAAAAEVDSLLVEEPPQAATSSEAAARPATAPMIFLDMRCCPFPAGGPAILLGGVVLSITGPRWESGDSQDVIDDELVERLVAEPPLSEGLDVEGLSHQPGCGLR